MEYTIIDFIEENWSAFVQRCTESGIPENEVEAEFDKIKEKLGV